MSKRRIAIAAALLVLAGGAVAAVLAGGSDEGAARQAAPPPTGAPPPEPIRAPALARRIDAAGLFEHLRELQSIARRSGGNRAAGTPGYDASAGYVESTLRRAGYRVRRQPVRFPYYDERSRPRVEGVEAPRDEIGTLAYSAGGRARGPVRAARELGCRRSDFAAVDRRSVAVVRRGVCPFRRKVANAQAAGAAAVVVYDAGASSPTAVVRGTLGRPGTRIPSVIVSRRVGERIAARAGSPLTVRVNAVSEMRRSDNVIAERPGRGRVVMAGAHLDSVPEGPGMNDNASGVSALLEIAEQTAARPLRGARRVRFAFWAAEELGLYGSKRYVRSLGRSGLRQVAAYLNLDMVGSRNAARLVYSGGGGPTSPMARAARAVLPVPLERTNLRSGSDHAPFRSAGVPVLGLFSGAFGLKSASQARAWGGRAGRPYDQCYHRRCDNVDGIDRRAIVQLTRGAVAALGAAVRR